MIQNQKALKAFFFFKTFLQPVQNFLSIPQVECLSILIFSKIFENLRSFLETLFKLPILIF